MKILLQDAQTRLYCGRGEAWVNEVEGAMEFPTIQSAGQIAQTDYGHADVNVILRYDNPQCELALNPAYCC
jgi:hypothetical protein